MEPPPSDEPDPPADQGDDDKPQTSSQIARPQQEPRVHPKPPASRSLQFASPAKSSSRSSPAKIVAAKVLGKYRKRRSSPVRSPLKPKAMRKQPWTDGEMKALVEHVAMPSEHVAMPSEHWERTTSSKWPTLPAENVFWQEAAQHIAVQCRMPIRTASSVRSRVTKMLAVTFPPERGGIEAAEKAYGLTISSYQGLPPQPSPPLASVPESPILSRLRETLSPTVPFSRSTATQTPQRDEQAGKIQSILEQLQQLDQEQHLSFTKDYANMLNLTVLEEVTNQLFLLLAQSKGVETYPHNFATLAAKGMVRLQEAGKPNIVHHFAKCLGEDRPGTTDPLMPLLRMPFGLVEYQIEFFSCTNSSQVKTPADYRHWLQMMEAEFGERFLKLFRGPMWSGFDADDAEMKDPLMARVNVASISHRALTADLAKSQFTTTPEIQEAALKQLKEAIPNGKFWIKVDGTDVKPALQESRRREWNGDVDLLDGKLQKLKEEYDNRREVASAENVDIAVISRHFKEDEQFLQEKLEATIKEYALKIKSATTSQEKLKELNWTIVETSNLIKQCQELHNAYNHAQDLSVEHKGVEEQHLEYLRHLYAKKRTPATHVLVLMLSDELRQLKPYALPVQYIPYHALKDSEVRAFCNKLKTKMKEYGLDCVGTVTDGEFSTLRTKGTTRPLHIVEVLSNVRASVNKLGKKALLRMLTICGENEAIPDDVIEKMSQAQDKKMAIAEVRAQLAPEGFQLSTWRANCPESMVDTFKTVVATYEFRAKLEKYSTEGVDFKNNLYAPEVDPITGSIHMEREDPNHELKRLAQHTRDGKFGGIRVSRFDEAMRSSETDLSQPALVGSRKQSVRDAEKLLSHAVAAFFHKKGYSAEAEYVKVIADWHEATDGRGMSQEERSAANKRMRAYILKDWTPWWTEESHLTQLDINRPLDSVCGFSRQTLIGITTNIESQEQRRNQVDRRPEHPRSSTTDDVECFFSLAHRKVHGQNPTLKEWKYNWLKLIWEFTNRMDTDLPFWYWTLNERFSANETLVSFDVPVETTPRLHQIQHRSREDSSIMAPGRAFLPAQHRTSVRQRFHRFEVGLPTVPEEFQAHVQHLLEDTEDS